MVSLGSLPFFLTMMNPLFARYATGVPKMKPLDSEPRTRSKSTPSRRSIMPSMASLKPSGSLMMVVMSLNMMPGLGKSGIVVT